VHTAPGTSDVVPDCLLLLPVQRPDAAGLQQLVAPVGASLQAAQALTEGRRGPAFNHYKAAADALQSLSWVVYTGPDCGMRCSASADLDLAKKLY